VFDAVDVTQQTHAPSTGKMWPVLSDWGQYTWSIARWKKPNETASSPTCWNWIDGASFDYEEDKYPYNVSAPFLPANYYPGEFKKQSCLQSHIVLTFSYQARLSLTLVSCSTTSFNSITFTK